MLFVIDQPGFGRTEYGVGFSCGCGFKHAPGGIAVELTEEQRRNGVKLYCPRCTQYAATWKAPIEPPPPDAASGLVRVVCKTCSAAADIPLEAVPRLDQCPSCGAITMSPIAADGVT